MSSPSIREAVGVDRSAKETKVGCEASLKVCCIELGCALLVNRELIGVNGVVWVINEGRTTILESFRIIGPQNNMVALQLTKMVQNQDHDGAHKW